MLAESSSLCFANLEPQRYAESCIQDRMLPPNGYPPGFRCSGNTNLRHWVRVASLDSRRKFSQRSGENFSSVFRDLGADRFWS